MFVFIGDVPCEKLYFNTADIVCKCNATYCDTISTVTPLPVGKYKIYTSSKKGLRFSLEEGNFEEPTNEEGFFEIYFYKKNLYFIL